MSNVSFIREFGHDEISWERLWKIFPSQHAVESFPFNETNDIFESSHTYFYSCSRHVGETEERITHYDYILTVYSILSFLNVT